MTTIQLTNLQCEHQLTAAELTQIVGGTVMMMYHASMPFRERAYFNDPNNSLGAVVTAIKESTLSEEQKSKALGFLWSNPDAVIQIIFPG